MVAWTSVAASWSIFGGIVVLGWWYYTHEGQRRRGGRATEHTASDHTDRKLAGNKARRRRESQRDHDTSEPASSDVAETSTADVKSGREGEGVLQQRQKEKRQKFVPLGESSAIDKIPATEKTLTRDDSDDVNNMEFARQLAKAKSGTTLSTAQRATKRVKTQKQSKVNGVLGSFGSAENAQSGTSSNTGGADADDDLSPTVSPFLQAASPSLDASGVADMLETPEPRLSSLRITESTQPQRSQQPRKAKKEEPVETKKQRQNRVRREKEKEAQREVEAQRKVLEEKQRRTAREAEGRPAKNGNGWTCASGLPANAWTQGSVPSSTPKSTLNAPLLDTHEVDSKRAADKATEDLSAGAEKIMNIIQPASVHSHTEDPVSSNGKAPSGASNGAQAGHWKNGLPSEEEQMRMFQEQSEDASWTTVPTNKRAKRRPASESKEKSTEAQTEAADFDVAI